LGLIPRIREMSPKFTELMSQNVQRLTAAQQFISISIGKIHREVFSREGDFDVLDPGKIDHELPAGFVIYELLSSTYGFKGDVIDSLCRALGHEVSGRRFYARDHVAWVDRGRILISVIRPDDSCEVDISEHAHRVYCSNSTIHAEHLDIDDIETPVQPRDIALLDADKLTFPLRVRRWAEGDSFIPLGMTGRKKVSDLLIDEKVPSAEKGRQLVVVSGEDIVWVVGHRIDDRYRLTDKTENVLRLTKELI
jgi:tRNA(Ile)-lysidine synthase